MMPDDTLPLTTARRAGIVTAVVGLYVIAGKLGLTLAFLHPSATPVWAPTGIAIAVLLLYGPGWWPAIWVGAFLVNLTTAGNVFTSIGIATGNALEGWLGAYCIQRWAGGTLVFHRTHTILLFVALAAGLSTIVSATLGPTSLALGGFARWHDYPGIWLTWWLGDATGAILVAPVLLLWLAPARGGPSARPGLELSVLAVVLILVGETVFSSVPSATTRRAALAFLCFPVILWPAFRFSAREAATSVVVLAGIAIHGTLHGGGPFARFPINTSLLLLQSFLGVAAVTGLVVSAAVAARRDAERQLRHLSVSDPATGLANYREFMAVLEREVQRFGRTKRPFAVLFLDVDRLKAINDQHGHLTGTRALCRVGEALKATCRAIDVPARYGGDEFALVLPESDARAALQAGRRVAERLASDTERPPVTVSIGVAVCPDDGATPETLLSSADRALYAVKPGHRRASPGGTEARKLK